MWAFRVGTLVVAAGALLAQRSYSPGDVQDGQRLFLANCAACHGPEGDAVPGVDLGHGKFQRASSDDDLIKIMQKGIANTAMPPNNFTDFQAGTIVAYLRDMAKPAAQSTLAGGDVTAGKAIFEGKGGCLACHRVKGNGSRVGPELTDIGALRRAVELERSVLDPDAEILPQNRSFRVVTRDGAATTGRLLNQDAFTVQLMDSNERLKSFSKSDLREYAFVDKSPMPSYTGKLSPKELADLVSYLASLKGVEKQ
ncbi:MAG TPA: c-type cytochrome [Bryobacteraceae bacterium]|nr:c-type cytochrome [Bryobacteraceae bacterium]